MGFLHFVQYHNAVPIALGLLFLGAGGVFAATNPEAIYDTTESVLAIDNTYIANKDLTAYTPLVEVVSVTEDGERYYVSYRLTTISVVDSVWRDVVRDRVLEVDKRLLGEYGDLGLYVTEQLKQVVDHESRYLAEAQRVERNQVSNKIVATAYSGIVGAMFDVDTERIPGYVPVVTPPVPESSAAPEHFSAAPDTSAPVSSENGSLTIQLLGENPVRVPINGEYKDLGVVVSGGENPTVHAYLNDVEKELGALIFDTKYAKMWQIRYVASDAKGATAEVSRTVDVYDPATQPPVVLPTPPPATTTEIISTPPETQPEPEPATETPSASSTNATSSTAL